MDEDRASPPARPFTRESSPFKSLFCSRGHNFAPTKSPKSDKRLLLHTLDVRRIATPASGSLLGGLDDESPRVRQSDASAAAVVPYIDKFKHLLSEQAVQAAKAAASVLSSQLYTLPKLQVDRSQWNASVAASLPLRLLPSGAAGPGAGGAEGAGGKGDQQDDVLGNQDLLFSAHHANGKGTLRPDRLAALVGTALERFFKAALQDGSSSPGVLFPDLLLEQRMLTLAGPQPDPPPASAAAAAHALSAAGPSGEAAGPLGGALANGAARKAVSRAASRTGAAAFAAAGGGTAGRKSAAGHAARTEALVSAVSALLSSHNDEPKEEEDEAPAYSPSAFILPSRKSAAGGLGGASRPTSAAAPSILRTSRSASLSKLEQAGEGGGPGEAKHVNIAETELDAEPGPASASKARAASAIQRRVSVSSLHSRSLPEDETSSSSDEEAVEIDDGSSSDGSSEDLLPRPRPVSGRVSQGRPSQHDQQLLSPRGIQKRAASPTALDGGAGHGGGQVTFRADVKSPEVAELRDAAAALSSAVSPSARKGAGVSRPTSAVSRVGGVSRPTSASASRAAAAASRPTSAKPPGMGASAGAPPGMGHIAHRNSNWASLQQAAAIAQAAHSYSMVVEPPPAASADDPWTANAGAVVLNDDEDASPNTASRRRRLRLAQASSRNASQSNLQARATHGSGSSAASSAAASRPASLNLAFLHAAQQSEAFSPHAALPGQGAAPAAGKGSAPAPALRASLQGVSLLFLQTLAGVVLREHGPQAAHRVTTAEVVARYIKSKTANMGLCFMDILPEAAQGPAKFLVSHRWESPFVGMVTTLTRHLHELQLLDPERVYCWLDFMAVDQHSFYTPAQLVGLTAQVSELTSQTLVVLDEDGLALTRTWVLFEAWLAAVQPGNKLTVLLVKTRATPLATELFRNLDVLRSETSKDGQRTALLEELQKRADALRSMAADGCLPAHLSNTTRAFANSLNPWGAPSPTKRSPFHGLLATDAPEEGGRGNAPGVASALLQEARSPRLGAGANALGGRSPRGDGEGIAAAEGDVAVSPRKATTVAALMHVDLGAVNGLLKEELRNSAMRWARFSSRALAAPQATHLAYIFYTTQAAVLCHLAGSPVDAEKLLRAVLYHQVSQRQGSLADLKRVATCLVDALVAQGKAEEGLLVARRVHELADRLLPRGHAMSVRTGLRLWDVLTFCGQHQPAEVLATSLHTLLDRIHNHKRDTTALSSTAGTPSLHHTASSVHSRASYGGALTSPGLAMAGTGSAGAPTAGGGAAPEGAPGASGSSFGLDMGTTEVDLAAAQIALGSSLLQARKAEEATDMLQAAWATYQELPGGTHHPRCIPLLMLLGESLAGSGLHGDAVSWYTQARSLMLHWYGRENAMWVDACCVQASALKALGDLRTAEKMLRRLLLQHTRMRFNEPAAGAVWSLEGQLAAITEEIKEDKRLAGRAFEVRCLLAEVLAARCTKVPLARGADAAAGTPTPHPPRGLASQQSIVSPSTAAVLPPQDLTPDEERLMRQILSNRVGKDLDDEQPQDSEMDVIRQLGWSTNFVGGRKQHAAAVLASQQLEVGGEQQSGGEGAGTPRAARSVFRIADLNARAGPASERSDGDRVLSEAVAIALHITQRYRRLAAAEIARNDGKDAKLNPTSTSGTAGGTPAAGGAAAAAQQLQQPPSSPGLRRRPQLGARPATQGAPTRTGLDSRQQDRFPGPSSPDHPTSLPGNRSSPKTSPPRFRQPSPPRGGSPPRTSPNAQALVRAGTAPAGMSKPRAAWRGSGAAAPSGPPGAAAGGAAASGKAGAGGAVQQGGQGEGGKGAALGRKAEQREQWRPKLMKLVEDLTDAGRALQEAGAHLSAHAAFSAAADMAEKVQGPGCVACLDAVACSVDVLMHMRCFVDARNLLTVMRQNGGMSGTSKDLLRSKVSPGLSRHAFAAVEQGDSEMLSWALQLGANTVLDDKQLLVRAVELGDLDSVHAVLHVAPASIAEEQPGTGTRALAMAAATGATDILEALLQAPMVSVDAQDAQGRSAIWHAAAAGHAPCVERLLLYSPHHRANPNMADLQRVTPLMAAAGNGHLAAAQLLIERGAHVDAQEEAQRTALMLAAGAGAAAVVDLLIRCRAKPYARDRDGQTALMMATGRGDVDTVSVLLCSKADITTQDYASQNALCKAAMNGHWHIAEMLMLGGLEPDELDGDHRTCLHLAAAGGHVTTIAKLVQFAVKGTHLRDAARMRSGMSGNRDDVPGVTMPTHIRAEVDRMLGERLDALSQQAPAAPKPPASNAALPNGATANAPASPMPNNAAGAAAAGRPQQQQQQQLALPKSHMNEVMRELLIGISVRARPSAAAAPTRSPPSPTKAAPAPKPTSPSKGDRQDPQRAVAPAGASANGARPPSNPSADQRQQLGSCEGERGGAGDGADGAPPRSVSPDTGARLALDSLRLLLGNVSHSTKARTFVCRRDKFGLTAGDLAVDQGHTQLGLLLRDFQQKPAVGGERRSAGGTVAFAGASGILPSGLSNTSVAAMLQEQQAKERQRLSAGLSPLGSDAPGPMTASGEGAGATVKRVGPALAAAQAPSRLSVNAGAAAGQLPSPGAGALPSRLGIVVPASPSSPHGTQASATASPQQSAASPSPGHRMSTSGAAHASPAQHRLLHSQKRTSTAGGGGSFKRQSHAGGGGGLGGGRASMGGAALPRGRGA